MSEHIYKTLTTSPIGSSAHALRITISNPPINIINATFLAETHSLLTSFQETAASADQTVPKVIVFSSSDDKIWLSHLDLHLISARYPPSLDVDSGATLHLLGKVIQLLHTLPIIFVAEIDGLAAGGGNELAVNMDMRFAGPNAHLGIPEVAGGVVHGGGLQRMAQLIGPARALQWNLSARGIDAHEAARIGWVNSAFENQDDLRKYVDDLAERIASFPRGGIEGTKRGILESLNGTGGMEKDMERLVTLAHTEEAQYAISAFIELGNDQERSGFELGLPDSSARVWEKP